MMPAFFVYLLAKMCYNFSYVTRRGNRRGNNY